MAGVVFLPMTPVVKALWAVNCAIAIVMLIVVSLRIFSRIHFRAGFGWDDAFILMSLVPALGMLVISGYFGHLFTGHPLSEIPIPNILLTSKLMLAYELLYVCAVGTTKLSILALYLRIFVQRYIRWGAMFGIGFVLFGELGMILQPFLMCHPWQAIYDKTIQGVCGNQHASLIAMGVWAMVTDFGVLALPVPALWSLQMNQKRKTALILVFTIGLLATAVATARVYVLAAVYLPNGDSTFTATWPDFLAVLEPNLNIVCISIPMLGSLFKRVRGKATTAASSEGPYSDLATFGQSGGDKFPNKAGSIRLGTLRTRTECRADAQSDSGSETALSPSAVLDTVSNEKREGRPVNLHSKTFGDGIMVSRSVHISESERI